MSDSIDLSRCDAPGGMCHVCGDVAVAGRVLEVDCVNRTALVAIGEDVVTVAVDLVDADVGDELLIHLGFAIERLVRA